MRRKNRKPGLIGILSPLFGPQVILYRYLTTRIAETLCLKFCQSFARENWNHPKIYVSALFIGVFLSVGIRFLSLSLLPAFLLIV